MYILLWIVFGAFVGWIASMIMGTNAQQGVVMNIIVGVIGAFLGSWIMSLLGQGGFTTFSWYAFLVALLGAVVLLYVVRIFRHA